MKLLATRQASGILFLACLLVPLQPAVQAGKIHTRDGKELDGEIHFQGADGLTITPPNGTATPVALADVVDATFADSAATTSPVDAHFEDAWKGLDIGEVVKPGSDQIDSKSGGFNLSASGWGILGSEDSLHLVYQPFHGDGQIIAHLVTPMGPPKNPPAADDLSAKTTAADIIPGITFRQDLTPGSPHASVTAWMLNADVKFKFRSVANELSAGDPFTALGDNGNNAGAPPRLWLRITRKGNVFSGYSSTDGKFWSLIDQNTVPMPADALVGLVMSTANNVMVGSAAFDHVSVTPGRFGLSFFPGSPFPETGIVLRDGSVIAGKVLLADRPPTTQPTDAPNPMTVRFQQSTDAVLQANDPAIHNIAATAVSALLFNGAPPELAVQLQSSNVPHGISLLTGDAMEGDLQGFDSKQIFITSVMWGSHQFDASSQAIAVILNPVTHPVLTTGTATPMSMPGWILKSRDGSAFLCTSITHEKDSVVAAVKGLGKITVADADLIELLSTNDK